MRSVSLLVAAGYVLTTLIVACPTSAYARRRPKPHVGRPKPTPKPQPEPYETEPGELVAPPTQQVTPPPIYTPPPVYPPPKPPPQPSPPPVGPPTEGQPPPGVGATEPGTVPPANVPQPPPPPGPPGKPKVPAQPLPPWLAKYGKLSLSWKWGRVGYDRNDIKGIWHASERIPWDRGLYVAFGGNDEFVLGFNLLVSAAFYNVNNGLKEEGLSFGVPRAGFALVGNIFSPNLSYMFTVLFSTSLGQTPFFVDSGLFWSVVPGKLLLSFGQHRLDLIPEEVTLFPHYQLVERALATRFFQINRSIGFRIGYVPVKPISLQVGVWNHSVEEVQTITANPIAFNQYNPDFRVMATAGIDLDLGTPYGNREGDFLYLSRPAFKVALRGYFLDIDRQGQTGQLGKSGHIWFANTFIGFKYKGLGISGALFGRWSQFVNLNPDLVDAGMYVQAGFYIVKRFLEVSARYSQIWPDIFQPLGSCPTCLHDPRSLPPPTTLSQSSVNLYDPPFPIGARVEIGGGFRILPTKDQQLSIGIVYLWRDHDSQFTLSVFTWI